MAGEWEDLTLGDLGRVVTGKTPLTAVEGNFGGQIPFVTPSDMDGRKTISTTARYLTNTGAASVKGSVIPAGAVMVSCIGSDMGKVVIAGRDCVTNQQINSIVVDDRFTSEFVYYALSTRKSEIRHQAAGGSAVPILNKGDFSCLEITLPPLAEQKAIAAVLGALDDKIELNRRMNATLEAMARALFQSWFVDFDPVRAKLDGRPPAALDPATAAFFPEHLEDSSLGHIPKGWKATTLGACIGFRSGFSFKSQDWQESGVPVVKIGSVKPGIIDLTQVSYVSEEIAQQAARYRLSTGDMLIGMTGYVGEVGLVPPSDNPPLLNQRVGKFVMAKPGTESLGFWYCTTRQPEFKAFVEARSHGTAQANVSGESIMEFPLVVPPSGIIDAFNRDCQPLLDRILSNHGESRTLATMRDTLLPKLLSGELSIN